MTVRREGEQVGGRRRPGAGRTTSRVGTVVVLNVAVAAAEAGIGLISGSLSLVSDALHNASDCGALVSTWAALRVMRRDRDRVKTYGYGRAEVLAALLNSVLLLAAVAAIMVAAVGRLTRPPEVDSGRMLYMALAAIAVNGASALLLHHEGHTDLNRRSAYLHMLSDVAFSAGVVAAAIVIRFTGWTVVDPLVSLLIGAVFARQAVGIAARSVNVLMEGAPPGFDLGSLVADIEAITGQGTVHDVHVWSVSSREHALSAHIERPPQRREPDSEILERVRRVVGDRYGITHQTIQVDEADPNGCPPCAHCEPRLAARPGRRDPVA